MLPDLSDKSGSGVRYTNHSLRATAITRMFNSGVLEKIISGHKSIKALRCYECKSEQQQQQVTAVINNGTDFETATCTESDDKTTALLVKQNAESHSVSKNFSGSFSNCTFNIHIFMHSNLIHLCLLCNVVLTGTTC